MTPIQAENILRREWVNVNVANDEFKCEYLFGLEGVLANHNPTGGTVVGTTIGAWLAVRGLVLILPWALFGPVAWAVQRVMTPAQATAVSLGVLACTPLLFGSIGFLVGYVCRWKQSIGLPRRVRDSLNLLSIIAFLARSLAMGFILWHVFRFAFSSTGNVWISLGYAVAPTMSGLMFAVLLVSLGCGIVWDIGFRPSDSFRCLCSHFFTRPDISATWDAMLVLADSSTKEKLQVKRSENATDILHAIEQANAAPSSWIERFIAHRDCVVLIGTSAFHQDEVRIHIECKLDSSLLQTICDETRRFRRGRYVCSKCLCRVSRQTFRDYDYWACRQCGNSREITSLNGPLIAVVHENHAQNYKLPEVNWSSFQRAFDFDEVEIREASARHVEAFVIQMRNESDPEQSRRVRRAVCRVMTPKLSENSIQQLTQLFHRVERVPDPLRELANASA